MKKKTLEELQELHSELCATAADLGVAVPEDLTVDFDTAEVGSTVCSNLDALIRKFRTGVDDDTGKGVASEDGESETAKAPKTKKTSVKKAKVTEAAPAEAGSEGEKTVAKKAKAKKVSPKKGAKKVVKKAAKANGTAKKKSGGGTRFDEDAKISWGAGKKNPAREDSGRFARIEAVKAASGKTVGAFLKARGNPKTLRNCVNAKLCSVA